MSDECKCLFSSAKLLITNYRTRLYMDIIETNKCLRAWFGRPAKGSFDVKDIGKKKGEIWDDHESIQVQDDEDNHDENQEGGFAIPIHVA